MAAAHPGLEVSDRLALAAIIWVACVRVGLWIAPLPKVRSLVARASSALRSPRQTCTPDPRVVGRAIEATRRAVPHATCLVLALAAEGLLKRLGHPPALHLGAGRTDGGAFRAHAWVECAGQVVVGGGPSGHQPLGALPPPGERS